MGRSPRRTIFAGMRLMTISRTADAVRAAKLQMLRQRKEAVRMARPAKPVAVLQAEGKSHRTKAELEKRKKEEAAFATGTPLKEKPETKKNLIAHKEFKRVTKLLTEIGKCDALYENIINRYCMLYAECRGYEEMRDGLLTDLMHLQDAFKEGEVDFLAYLEKKSGITGSINAIDRQLQTKRKMLMDIEKENIMTVASVLRNIPKTEEPDENPLLIALRGGGA